MLNSTAACFHGVGLTAFNGGLGALFLEVLCHARRRPHSLLHTGLSLDAQKARLPSPGTVFFSEKRRTHYQRPGSTLALSFYSCHHGPIG